MMVTKVWLAELPVHGTLTRISLTSKFSKEVYHVLFSPLHRPWYSWYIDENIVDIKIFQRRNQSSAAASPYQESPLAKNGGTLVVTDVIKWLERPCHPMQNCIRYLL